MKETTKHCIGRFSFAVPTQLSTAGRIQKIYDAEVKQLPMPSGGIDAYWSKRLASIGSGAKIVDLAPGVKASWSIRIPSSPADVTIEAVKPVSGGGLSATIVADAGRENFGEIVIKAILDAYSPSNDHGFCLESGAITTEPSESEQVGITMQDVNDTKVELQFDTQTVAKPNIRSQTDVQASREFISDIDGTLKVLRDHQRSAAGLMGAETWLLASASNLPPSLKFTWHFAGTGDDSTEPSIDIQASAPATKQAELEQIWESIMTTLKKVPLPAPRAK